MFTRTSLFCILFDLLSHTVILKIRTRSPKHIQLFFSSFQVYFNSSGYIIHNYMSSNITNTIVTISWRLERIERTED